MSKHTPGPWSHRNGRIFQTDYDVLTIANVSRAFDGDYSPSNGDLIAAAPELLEALEVMLNGDEMGEYECQRTGFPRMIQRREKARAAIAKAKGEK